MFFLQNVCWKIILQKTADISLSINKCQTHIHLSICVVLKIVEIVVFPLNAHLNLK